MTDAPIGTDIANPAIATAAEQVFGARLELATRFAGRLTGAGTHRGLLGPREVPRLWERHLLNCAAVAALLPPGARVVDVGSGAGLPGLVLAVARPDLQLDLVEPMLRRTTFLDETVEELGLRDAVRIHRGRAESPLIRHAVGGAAWATARAVAPLDRLVEWCLPLLRPGGAVLALKGAGAAAEAEEHQQRIHDLGGSTPEVLKVATGRALTDALVVRVQRTTSDQQRGRRRGR